MDVPDDLPPVLGDEPALRRVFQNLVGNAIKYGAAGGWIGIERPPAGQRRARHGHRIAGSASTRPITHASSSRSIERRQSSTAQIQGAGLGLSLVKRIVEAHGGAISVRSAPGAGRGVHRALPIAASEPRASGVRVRPPLSESPSRNRRRGAPLLVKRLLLVEDEPGLVLTLTDRLTREGYDVQSTADGESGLARATSEAFDLVLLDVMLPRLGGFDVAARAPEAEHRDAGDHAHGARSGRRQGRRAEARRRRLRDEAVRDGRAPGAHRGQAPARARDDRSPPTGTSSATSTSTSGVLR